MKAHFWISTGPVLRGPIYGEFGLVIVKEVGLVTNQSLLSKQADKAVNFKEFSFTFFFFGAIQS